MVFLLISCDYPIKAKEGGGMGAGSCHGRLFKNKRPGLFQDCCYTKALDLKNVMLRCGIWISVSGFMRLSDVIEMWNAVFRRLIDD